MSNITNLENNILDLVPGSTVLVIGARSAHQLLGLALHAGDVWAFSADDKTKSFVGDLKHDQIHLVSSADEAHAVIPRLMIIDAHHGRKQLDGEMTVLKSFQTKIDECRPLMFIRCDDPHWGSSIVDWLEQKLDYKSYYWVEFHEGQSDDVLGIWLFAIPVAMAPEFDGWNDAKATGHPYQADDPVYEYVVKETGEILSSSKSEPM